MLLGIMEWSPVKFLYIFIYFFIYFFFGFKIELKRLADQIFKYIDNDQLSLLNLIIFREPKFGPNTPRIS